MATPKTRTGLLAMYPVTLRAPGGPSLPNGSLAVVHGSLPRAKSSAKVWQLYGAE